LAKPCDFTRAAPDFKGRLVSQKIVVAFPFKKYSRLIHSFTCQMWRSEQFAVDSTAIQSMILMETHPSSFDFTLGTA